MQIVEKCANCWKVCKLLKSVHIVDEVCKMRRKYVKVCCSSKSVQKVEKIWVKVCCNSKSVQKVEKIWVKVQKGLFNIGSSLWWNNLLLSKILYCHWQIDGKQAPVKSLYTENFDKWQLFAYILNFEHTLFTLSTSLSIFLILSHNFPYFLSILSFLNF